MVVLVVVPSVLLLISLFGLGFGSPISVSVASTAPAAALALSVAGLGAAILNGRRQPIAIAGLGLFISSLGMLLLWWIARSGSRL